MSDGASPGAGGQGEENPRDQFSEGVDRLRETAKWMVAAFAAVGATLVAGTQLASIGRFGLAEWRLWVAVVAAAIAFVLIGWMIWFAVRVLIGGRTSIDDLVDETENNPTSEDARFVDRHPQLRAAFPTIRALRDEYNVTIAQREEAGKSDDSARFKRLNGRLVYLERVINGLLLALRYDKVYRLFKRASVTMLFLGFGAALAILTFVWAANPPPTSAGGTTAANSTTPTKQADPPADRPLVCIVNSQTMLGEGTTDVEITTITEGTTARTEVYTNSSMAEGTP